MASQKIQFYATFLVAILIQQTLGNNFMSSVNVICSSILFYFLFYVNLFPFPCIGCSIDLENNDPDHPPFVVNTENEILQPVLEGSARVLNVPNGEEVTLACPGKGNTLLVTGGQVNAAACVSGTSFELEDLAKPQKFSDLGCAKDVQDTVKETGTCYDDSTLVEIGWDIGDSFVNQLTICHDKITANTLYSIDRIEGVSIAATDTSHTRPGFKKGPFFKGIDVDKAYSQSGQKEMLDYLLGEDQANRFFDIHKQWYFARGHFAPDGDFIDGGSQDATYYYINTAPQWQAFNNGNWKYLETSVRNKASERSLTYTTYSGGFEVLELPDKDGDMQPIYLANDSEGYAIIPAPKYYWKVVHDPIAKAATAYVGINNPHLTEVTADDIFCNDVCDKLSEWIDDRRFEIGSGYMFCCTLSDLKKVVPFAPNLGRVKLLV